MKLTGPWSKPDIDAHLAGERLPVRLGVRGSGDGVMVLSVWYIWRDDCLWCASSEKAALVRALRKNPACGFEIARDEPPYFGVRGQGTVSFEPGGDGLLKELYQRYGGDLTHDFATWLLGRDADEVAIRIRPEKMMSWDYRERMRGAFAAD
ncbi:MAG: pyridoxamine 5'-phosphate oxidase family protein [Minwuia sp.]|uniref:pyridoxamine 5'-phosphate oxidase family protein n=1 Tax=Minwuia sp. TaxID=2493630 RepID=UPI003A8C5E64